MLVSLRVLREVPAFLEVSYALVGVQINVNIGHLILVFMMPLGFYTPESLTSLLSALCCSTVFRL